MDLKLTPDEIDLVEANLVAARSLISDPDHWTTGAFARAESGRATGYRTPGAVCFCSLGSVKRTAKTEVISDKTALVLWQWVVENSDHEAVEPFNDNSNHTEVLAMFDGTLEAVRGMR